MKTKSCFPKCVATVVRPWTTLPLVTFLLATLVSSFLPLASHAVDPSDLTEFANGDAVPDTALILVDDPGNADGNGYTLKTVPWDELESWLAADYQPLAANLTTWAGITPSANVQSFNTAANYAAMKSLLTITESDITDLGTYLATGDIDTLAELNSIVGDATLVDTGHAHTESDISDLGSYLTSESNDLTASVTWPTSATLDTITEKTTDAGVTVEGVEFENNNIILELGNLWVKNGGSYKLRTSRTDPALHISSDGYFSWYSTTTTFSGASDLRLYRDATGILAQRNATNAQEQRWYKTYTNASNGSWVEMGFQDTADVFVIKTDANGTGGTAAGMEFGDSSSDLSFYGATPVAQPSGTGEATGFTAGSGTGVNDDSTFTGNVGSTAYRINDVVKALKQLGLLAE